MNDTDDWGRDPQVRTMRRVFAHMETLQSQLLVKIGISPFDGRLGRWRPAALRLFEQEWAALSRKGCAFSEEKAARTYVKCLGGILRKDGVIVADEALESVR
jgi:hypothetical protein